MAACAFAGFASLAVYAQEHEPRWDCPPEVGGERPPTREHVDYCLERRLDEAIACTPLIDEDAVEVDVENGTAILRGNVEDMLAYRALIRTVHALGIRYLDEKDLFIGGLPSPAERPEPESVP